LQDSELEIWLGASYCLPCWFKKNLFQSLHKCNHRYILRFQLL